VHRRHRAAAAVTQAPPASRWRSRAGSCRAALALFTVIPVRADATISKDTAARAVAWLPAVGVLIAVPAAAVLAAAEGGGHSPLRRLLAACLAVAVLAVLTGGLHLDGLADTADGLGSRRPAAAALAIMRRPDIGPFGVTALLLVLLLQVSALAAVPAGLPAAAAVVLAAVTGRVAVLLATGPASPAARSEGLGALVAGATGPRARIIALTLLLAAAAAGGAAIGGPAVAVRGVGAAAAGLLTALLVRRLALRQLGGLTGDVFGAVIELSAAAVLVAAALSG
jgi:adenosylcobinamide-GDP ribazoletransferase